MVITQKRQTRWERFRPQRHLLMLRALDLECVAEDLENVCRAGELPGHILQNFGDVANRLRAEAQYVKAARRELR